jgi:hypothetical protein
MENAQLPDFLELVYVLETYYRVPIEKRMSQEESLGYFRQLRRFSLEIVAEACERTPHAYPSFFPKVGEWATVCEQVAAELGFQQKRRNEVDSQREFQRMAHCAHEFYEEPEPPNTFFTKFDVCAFCGLAKPTINRSAAFSKAASYLTAGLRA